MGDMTRSETKCKPTFEGKPLLVEAAPIMAPRFEQTLHHMVNPTLERGYPVVVFCIPSSRKMTQKATWADHWNRRYTSKFSFVQRCLCAFDKTQQEHRMVCSGINMPLPNHNCDTLTHRENTNVLGQLATVTAMVAMIGMLGSQVRVQRPSVLIPRPAKRNRDRALNPTILIDTRTERIGDSHERTLDEPTHAFPMDAKEREKAHRKKLKEEGKDHHAKQRKKIVEDHHDDCGDDLSSLQDESFSGLAHPDLLREVLLLKADEYELHAQDEHEYGEPIPQMTCVVAVGLSPPEAPTYARDLDGSLVRPPLPDCEACSLGRGSTDASHNCLSSRLYLDDEYRLHSP